MGEAGDPCAGVRGVFTLGDQTVSAELTFDTAGDLVDFVSEDRSRASEDGKSFRRQSWSTPLSGYRSVDGRRLLTTGEGRWQDPEGWFTYIELEFDQIVYNVSNVANVSNVDGSQEPSALSHR